jgi:hypothetical protein
MFRAVFWVILPCKMMVDRRFRGAYCLHHQGWVYSSLMMDAVRTSETSVDHHFTRQYNPEDSSEHQLWPYFSVLSFKYITLCITIPWAYNATCQDVFCNINPLLTWILYVSTFNSYTIQGKNIQHHVMERQVSLRYSHRLLYWGWFLPHGKMVRKLCQ